MRSNRNQLREITSENLLQELNETLFVHFFFIDGTGPYTPPEENLMFLCEGSGRRSRAETKESCCGGRKQSGFEQYLKWWGKFGGVIFLYGKLFVNEVPRTDCHRVSAFQDHRHDFNLHVVRHKRDGDK